MAAAGSRRRGQHRRGFSTLQQELQLFLQRGRSVMQPLRHLMWPRLARSLFATPLTDPPPVVPEELVQALAERLEDSAQQRLGRSLSIRQVDAGSCNGCELEINALNNVVHDLERFGLRFVASPRHADVLLVTGPLTRNMREALERT